MGWIFTIKANSFLLVIFPYYIVPKGFVGRKDTSVHLPLIYELSCNLSREFSTYKKRIQYL